MMVQPQLFQTIEEAMEFVKTENTHCQIEWYSLGKSRGQFLKYFELKGINPKDHGVFISGRFDPPWIGRLTFMPVSWVNLDS